MSSHQAAAELSTGPATARDADPARLVGAPTCRSVTLLSLRKRVITLVAGVHWILGSWGGPSS
jgi:hypothetical protein